MEEHSIEDGNGTSSSWRLKHNFVFYSSALPCGDASIVEMNLDDNHPLPAKRVRTGILDDFRSVRVQKGEEDVFRTGARPVEENDPKGAGAAFHRLGVSRTKGGRGPEWNCARQKFIYRRFRSYGRSLQTTIPDQQIFSWLRCTALAQLRDLLNKTDLRSLLMGPSRRRVKGVPPAAKNARSSRLSTLLFTSFKHSTFVELELLTELKHFDESEMLESVSDVSEKPDSSASPLKSGSLRFQSGISGELGTCGSLRSISELHLVFVK